MKALILRSALDKGARFCVVVANVFELNEPKIVEGVDYSEGASTYHYAWENGARCVIRDIAGEEHYPLETFDEIMNALSAEFVRSEAVDEVSSG